jgi:hypothetical protein
MTIKRKLLFAIKCPLCDTEFVYCINSGRDTRCYDCKSKKGSLESLKEIQDELKNMDEEEIQAFEQEIREYEEENGKIK